MSFVCRPSGSYWNSVAWPMGSVTVTLETDSPNAYEYRLVTSRRGLPGAGSRYFLPLRVGWPQTSVSVKLVNPISFRDSCLRSDGYEKALDEPSGFVKLSGRSKWS